MVPTGMVGVEVAVEVRVNTGALVTPVRVGPMSHSRLRSANLFILQILQLTLMSKKTWMPVMAPLMQEAMSHGMIGTIISIAVHLEVRQDLIPGKVVVVRPAAARARGLLLVPRAQGVSQTLKAKGDLGAIPPSLLVSNRT